MARSAKKTTARRRTTTARKAAPARKATRAVAPPKETASVAPDLAGGLKSFLGIIESEVRAVTGLTERIDALVGELNAVRDEQAQRLIALDNLRATATDGGLTSFLDKLIRPRMPRVPEVVPDRLNQ
ncbi:MAG TPA: hypothetical protein VFH54_18910 [Mycobacteriales bacterium]|nr:hypothetical protein [Mycobacteriales bacterium]